MSTINIVGGLDLGIEKCKGARLGGGNIDGLPEGSGQDWIAGGAFDEWPPRSRWKYQSNTQSRECCPPKERHQVRVPTKAPMRGRTKTLEALGVKLYGIEDSNCVQEGKCVSWDNIAGYYDL